MVSSGVHSVHPSPRILIFRGGAIGDFILTLPVLSALREAWPQAYIELIGYPHIAELARVAGLIDHVLFIESARFSSYFMVHTVLPPSDVSFIRSFDMVISYLHDPDEVIRANLIQAGARRVISVPPQMPSGHAIDHFMRAVEPLGLKRHGVESPQLHLPTAYRTQGKSRLEQMGLYGDIIAIHPGSGSAKKNWPLCSFLALAERIQQARRMGRPLWILGEADEAIAQALERHDSMHRNFPPKADPPTADNPLPFSPPVTASLASAGQARTATTPMICSGRSLERQLPRSAGPHTIESVLKNCSLLEVESVLSACRGYVGNDSGITHLAAALGIPTLALFGPTDPAVWGPRGKQVLILCGSSPTTEGLEGLQVDEVFRALNKLIPLTLRRGTTADRSPSPARGEGISSPLTGEDER